MTTYVYCVMIGPEGTDIDRRPADNRHMVGVVSAYRNHYDEWTVMAYVEAPRKEYAEREAWKMWNESGLSCPAMRAGKGKK